MNPAGLATLLGLLALGGSSYAQDRSPTAVAFQVAPEPSAADSAVSPEDVPFVAQEPLLCGGAAAVMVERYWGRTGVYADAYAHLVLEDEGGIRAADLLSAMEARGLDTDVSTGAPEGAFAALSRGVPSILLLTGGDPALHYVVLVGADHDRVWIHDPNFGPGLVLSRERLMERWAGSGHLTLTALPAWSDEEVDPTPTNRTSSRAGPSRASDTTDAPAPPELRPLLDSTIISLRSGDHVQARDMARRVIEDEGPSADLARRVLATSFYLDDRPLEALDAWNALSEPAIDLVEIRGGAHVRHHVMTAHLGLEPTSVLTAHELRLARRRLAAIPAIATSRVDYAPLPDGTVQVRGFTTEEPRWPSPLSLLGEAVSAGVDRQLSVELGPFLSFGDRWTLRRSWRTSQEITRIGFSAASQRIPGVVGVSLDIRRELHAVAGSTRTEDRRRSALLMDRWVTPSLRLGGGVAMELWRAGAPGQVVGGDGRRLGSALARLTWSPMGWLDAAASGEGWWGSGTDYRRGSIELRLGGEVDRRWGLQTKLGAAAASPEAPRTVWPGVGTGEIRDGLLRGHPLQVDGRIAGPGMGRRLAHGTVEGRRFWSLGPLRAGVALFLDGARVWPGDGVSPPRTFFDPGGGLFVDTGTREIRMDVARGQDRWVFSARVTLSPRR